MRKIFAFFVLLTSFNSYAQLDETMVMGIPTGTTAEINAVTPEEEGAIVYNSETKKIMVYTDSGWVNTSNSDTDNWLTTGNSGATDANFLGTSDDVKMQIRSNNLSMLEFGRRETLGLYQDYPGYTDNDQPLVYLNGNGSISALQFAASGASFYKPMFYTTLNGNFRLKGATGGTDLFEIGSAGPDNKGLLEFIIGDDGAEPIIFKRYNYYDKTLKELFRVQGSDNVSGAKPRFGINLNPIGIPIDGTYNTADAGNIANSTFQVNGSVSKSIFTTLGNLELNEDYHTIILGGDHTISLPTASTCNGRIYVIKNSNAVSTSISAYLNEQGTSATTIVSHSLLWIQSDGTSWQQISESKSSEIFVSGDANNVISVGTDGGAYKAFRIFDGYDSFGGQTISDDSFIQLNINESRTNLGGFDLINDNISIPEDGVYEITYSVTFRNTSSSRSSILSELRLGGSKIVASDLYTYHRIFSGKGISNQVSHQTGSRTLILSLEESDLLSIHSRRFEGDGTLITVADAISITIKKLN